MLGRAGVILVEQLYWQETSVVASQFRCHGQHVLKAYNSQTSSFAHLLMSLSGSLLHRVNKSHLLSPCVSLQLSAGVRRISCQGWSPFFSHEPVCPRAHTWRLHARSAPTHAESALTLWTGPSEPSGPPAEPSGAVSSAVWAWGCQQRRSYSHRSGLAASDGTPGGRVSPRPDLCCGQHSFFMLVRCFHSEGVRLLKMQITCTLC